MNENHFIFSLIRKSTKKYRDISDDIMEWAVMCATRDWLIWTRDWDHSWAVWFQSLVSAKDWSRKWHDPLCVKEMLKICMCRTTQVFSMRYILLTSAVSTKASVLIKVVDHDCPCTGIVTAVFIVAPHVIDCVHV